MLERLLCQCWRACCSECGEIQDFECAMPFQLCLKNKVKYTGNISVQAEPKTIRLK